MELLFPIFAFFCGALIDRAVLNRGWDNDRCEKVKNQIDLVVRLFHERFSDFPEIRKNASTLFDYEIMSLVDDTTLVPIIGTRTFDGAYIKLISEIFRLSKVDPAATKEGERASLLDDLNKHAVDLKKVISSSQKQFRIFDRS